MIALAIIILGFLGTISFVILRISVSCMFWWSKKPNDKQYVFRTSFPYYIITLFVLGTLAVVKLDFNISAIYFFAVIYMLVLLIWSFKLKHSKRKYVETHNNDESQNSNLP